MRHVPDSVSAVKTYKETQTAGDSEDRGMGRCWVGDGWMDG